MLGAAPSREHILPSIGVITALPKEFAAVKSLLDEPKEVFAVGTGANRRYVLAEVPAPNGGQHSVALALLTDMGNNSAAIRATLLLQDHPTIRSIIMVGIAGGVPHPEKASEHVRLGDIVVSDRGGVVQYDFDKETAAENIIRHAPRPPSASLLDGVRHLQAAELEGNRPWERYIAVATRQLGVTRPSTKTDVLANSHVPTSTVPHPRDRLRRAKWPRVFVGTIASANKLLKNPIKRDAIRDRFGVKAVEMEGSGIADATWTHEVGYLIVRGICDYCDANKGDAWQEYAAIVAAAYARALLESIPSEADGAGPSHATAAAPGPAWWQRLAAVAAVLYPQGPEAAQIWERAGGDLAVLDLRQPGRASWFAAVTKLRLGGGGHSITGDTLLRAMRDDFPGNDELQELSLQELSHG